MKRVLIALTILLTAALTVTAEEQHIIDSFIIEVDGSTKEKALLREMDIKEGQAFASQEDLLKAVAEQKQDLINLRVFNSVEMETLQVASEEDQHHYDVAVKLEDTWTIIPFPYPKYDSNTGFRIGMKFFYDNAFGSLNNFYLGMNLDINYRDSKWQTGNWTFNPQLNEVKIGKQEYNFSLMQQYSEIRKLDGETVLEDYGVYNTSFGVDTTFDITRDYFYKISPSVGFNYGYSGTNYQGNEEPFYLSFGHSGGYSRVDWVGNFREGYSLVAGNGLSYVYNPDQDDKVKFDISLDSRYFWIINNRLNYSNRAYGVYSFNDELTGLGHNVRGVKNDSMYGVGGVFFSNDLNISVIQWKGVGEAQFQPFFDVGMVKREDIAFDPDKDIRYGTGADFILYLDAMRGLHARATIGVDLSSDLSWKEAGKYELIITSSLSY